MPGLHWARPGLDLLGHGQSDPFVKPPTCLLGHDVTPVCYNFERYNMLSLRIVLPLISRFVLFNRCAIHRCMISWSWLWY
jgi:hypothetical protein